MNECLASFDAATWWASRLRFMVNRKRAVVCYPLLLFLIRPLSLSPSISIQAMTYVLFSTGYILHSGRHLLQERRLMA